ncbi:MAG: hypothetical protein A3K19_28520 [Lentisphaerae bacterium RIFOXYB12_FULL_65_16]|nr:MAG: hypothetical protein A3K18_19770 [Lentisphaerae bacterium RIFOXYA12_64_32]OGV85531.1 MAG: hypothetical protein A3K19_28520 [Lentisphaerae bacterium RIFOXYB12_FULL_65_16]
MLKQHGSCVWGAVLAGAVVLGGCRQVGAPAQPAPGVTRPATADFYVSTQGRDTWSGKRAEPVPDGSDGPLASLAAAQAAVRQCLAAGPRTQPLTVLVRGGTYELAAPLVFGPQDSGTEQGPVVYAAYPGERAVISGGTRITGWTPDAGGVWKAPVPEAKGGKWIFHQLYVDGYRRVLARMPNEGQYFRIDGPGGSFIDPATGKEVDGRKQAFRYKEGDVKAWPRLTEIEMVSLRNWESAILPVRSVDEATRKLVFTGPMKWEFVKPDRYYLQNFREALDAPGEWWLDRQEGMLYYVPKPGEDMARVSVVAPRMTEFVRLQGESALGRYAEHITFEGLVFAGTDYTVEPEGHSDWQAAVTVPAAIQADGAAHITIRGCEVRNVGHYAIWFRRGCAYNRIEQTEIFDVGAGGVRFGEPGVCKEEGDRTHHNVVHNCFIHDGGCVFYGAHPVWVGQSSDNEITHNELCDFNYTGIAVGWSWGFNPTTCHRNRIEYNHLHHLGRGVLYDMAAIYTLGISTGTNIRYNHIHHIWGWEEGYGAGGIYPDEGSSGILIENNLVYETQVGGFTMHYGREDVVRNNIFAFGQRSQIHLGRADKESSQTLLNNIVYFREGGFIERMSTLTADNNVYWRTDGESITFPGDLDLAAWQVKGYDQHSVIADPLFVNAEKFDFRLRPESPALKLGFKPFDAEIATAGLLGPKDWTARPKRVERPKAVFLPKPDIPPQPVQDEFEDTPVAELPAFGTVYGETPQAQVRVTDETAAAGGKRSLKFTDAAGLDQEWNPHIAVNPYLKDGVLHGSFDVRLEPGAKFYHEWRTNGSPFVAGPSFNATPGGEIKFNGQVLGTAPVSTWFHVDITCDVRTKDTRTATIVVTVPGKTDPIAATVSVNPKFKSLDWVVYVANATDKVVFFLDNVVLELQK